MPGDDAGSGDEVQAALVASLRVSRTQRLSSRVWEPAHDLPVTDIDQVLVANLILGCVMQVNLSIHTARPQFEVFDPAPPRRRSGTWLGTRSRSRPDNRWPVPHACQNELSTAVTDGHACAPVNGV